ncbi:MAG TPA: ABC transporter permease, partial [Rhodobacteraceae bacterium]|nr:ABC transporter permease [Paracoccaceae bacterium]
LKIFPVAGFQGFENLVLPSLTLGLGLASVSNRVVRDAVIDAMNSDWQMFARTKGLSSRLTLIRHVMRNAS